MNVKELKEIIQDLDDDIIVITNVVMEQGRGCSGGLDRNPSVCLYEVGEFDRMINEDLCDYTEEGWIEDEEGGMKNTIPLLVLEGDVEEEWYQ